MLMRSLLVVALALPLLFLDAGCSSRDRKPRQASVKPAANEPEVDVEPEVSEGWNARLSGARNSVGEPERVISLLETVTLEARRPPEEAVERLAFAYGRLGRYGDAETALEHGLKAAPGSARLRTIQARLLCEQGAAELRNEGSSKAAGLFRQALAAVPGKHPARAEIREKVASAYRDAAQTLEDSSEHLRAIALLKESLEIDPDNPISIRMLGNVLRGSGRAKDAASFYELFLMYEPRDRQVRQELAALYRELGDDVRAQQMLAGAAPSPEPSATGETASTDEAAPAGEGDGALDAELEKELAAAADDRTRVSILTASAREAVTAGDHAGAGSLYRRALELSPGNRELLLGLAEACRSGRRPAEAIQIYNELLAAKPSDHPTRFALAKALIATGKARQALQQLEMLTQEPTLDRALLLDVTNWVGITHAQLGDFSAAKQAWDEVLRIDPDHANAHYNQGQILEKQHRFNEAISEFQKAVGCGASDPDYFRYLDRLGLAYRQAGQTQQALEIWGKLIAVAPAGSPYAVKAQQFLARHGGSARTTRIDAATGQVTAVDSSRGTTQPAMPWRRATPEGGTSATGAAEAELLAAAERFFRQGRVDDAIRQYEQALEVNPANGQTYFKLGDLYHQRNDLAREKALFQLMVAQNLPAELAQAARFRLQGLGKP